MIKTETNLRCPCWLVACGIFAGNILFCQVPGANGQLPQIDSLSSSSRALSGRLLIYGTNFGVEQGDGNVLIDGVPAIATTWTESEIHAYVPENAALGTVTVQVETSDGISNVQFLEVVLRESEGRFRWRFEMDFRSTGAWSAVGPDGTIYCSDPFRLYAVSPDGALKWTVDDAGGERPISVSADGNIYSATNLGAGEPEGVIALNPDGSVRWTHVVETGGDLLAGPSLGPDGNIYAVSNSNLGGDGTFALDSNGNLLWSNPTGSDGGANYEILFGTDQIYIPIFGNGGGPEIRTYDYQGNLMWTSGDLELAPGSAPELDPSGRLILQWIVAGVQAWSPDGEVAWIYDPPGTLGLVVPPTVGADGVIYSGTYGGGDLFAVNPDGTTKWLVEDRVDGFLWHLAVSPDDRVLIDGGAPDFGAVPSSIRGFDTENGDPLWIQNFHVENGLNEFAAWIEPSFSNDGNTIYVNTEFSSNTQSGYLYAVDISAESGLAGDVNGDGTINLLDIAPFVELLSTGTFQAEADINLDGTVDLLDVQPFVELLSNG